MEVASLIESYRKAEFLKLSRTIMTWIGIPVITFWSVCDYQEWGFADPFWVPFRVAFVFVALGCFFLTRFRPVEERAHQLPILLCTTYILAFCSFFITQSGYGVSRYLVGMPQVVLALSFLPFRPVEFTTIASIFIVVPIFVATRWFSDAAFFLSVPFQHYLTYSMFSGLTFAVVNAARHASYRNRALLVRDQERQRLVIEQQAREIANARVAIAVANTTKMVAHDVRKPFSMLQSALAIIERTSAAGSLTQVREITAKWVPQIRATATRVSGMLQDIMDVGSEVTLHREAASAQSLIESTLAEVTRMHPHAEIDLSLDYRHTHDLFVDTVRAQRVLTNIVSNAFQAMGGTGRLWIETGDVQSGDCCRQVEFRIKNSNSHIDQSDIGRIFDAFYTKGKRGGTGLGLAIAHKMVNAHGGTISCSSVAGVGVEFVFTLPAHGRRSFVASDFPRSTKQLLQRLAGSPGEMIAGMAVEEETESELESWVRGLDRSVCLLVVDDEAVYRNAIQCLASSIDTSVLSIDSAVDASSGMAEASQHYDVVIVDVDLGAEGYDGYDVVREFRRTGSEAYICVHSNRSYEGERTKVRESGADVFLPKPISRFHLLRLLKNAVDRSVMTVSADKQRVDRMR